MKPRRPTSIAQRDRIPAPADAVDPRHAPSSLTFFLSAAERRAVLAELRKHHSDRGAALLAALRISTTNGDAA